jgi:transcriptional regulator with XRE-family HTH domain
MPSPEDRVRNAELAKRLKLIMAERELTQSGVAELIGPGRYTNTEGKYVVRGRDRISQWLAGKNFPNKESLAKLAKALNVKVSDLSPEQETRVAQRTPANWSVTTLHDGRIFLQAATYLKPEIASEIARLLFENDR